MSIVLLGSGFIVAVVVCVYLFLKLQRSKRENGKLKGLCEGDKDWKRNLAGIDVLNFNHNLNSIPTEKCQV